MKVSKVAEIEARHGKKIDQVLVDYYRKLGSQTKVARELGVAQGTVSWWLMKYGLQEKTILVKKSRSSVYPNNAA